MTTLRAGRAATWAIPLRIAGFVCLSAALVAGCGGSGSGGKGGTQDSGTPAFDSETGGADSAVTPDTGPTGGTTPDQGPIGGTADASTDGPPPQCQCERDLVCDDKGDCVEANPCTGDQNCLAGRICTDGACADGCADDAACAGAGLATTCSDGRCVQCTDDCYGAATCDATTHLCVEPANCTDSRECNAPDTCNNRTMVCTPPRNCHNPDQACRGGLVCSDDGRCRQPVECASNDECPFGEVCAPGRPRTCRACVNNAECGGALVCDHGVCTDVGGCVDDAGCVGDRVCTGGACTAPACVDDASEENDTPELAQQLPGATSFQAQSCGADDDYYKFNLAHGSVATFTVEADSLGAELDIDLTDVAGAPVAVGNTSGTTESAVVGPFAIDRVIVVRVFERGAPSAVGYTVSLDIREAAGVACIDDAIDVARNDDTQAEATQLRAAGTPAIDTQIDGKICQDDDDWYCLALDDGEDLQIDGSVSQGDVVLAADLVSASTGMSISQVLWQRGVEGMPLSRAARGSYCVHLHAQSGTGAYHLHVVTVNRAAQSLCGSAEALAFDASGVAHADGRLAADDTIVASCGDPQSGAGEAIYTVTVDAPHLLVARVTGAAEGTLGDPLLSARTVCSSAAAEVACNDDRPDPESPFLAQANPAEIRVPIEQAGTVSLIVDGTSPGARPDFGLDAQLLPLAAPPVNDRCAGATDIALLDGLGRIRVNLDRAHDDFGAACLPATGPDAVYHLRLDARSRVSVQVFADFAVGAYLTAVCGQGAALACGSGFDMADVPAGDYFLVIEGIGSQARGRVQGQVAVDAVGAAPANDTCARPIDLDGAGGSLDGDTRAAADDSQLAVPNNCTGGGTLGGDVYFRLPTTGGTSYFVEAVPDAGWDLSLYASPNCEHPGQNCLAGHDGALTERIEFTAPVNGGDVFVVVDGANHEAGRFHLTWGALAP